MSLLFLPPETHWLQRRHFSPLFPKAEEHVVKQSQLLDGIYFLLYSIYTNFSLLSMYLFEYII